MKRITVLTILTVFVFILGGCGSVDKANQGDPGNTSSDIVKLKNQISELANKGVLDVQGVGLNSKRGKVNIYLTPDSLEQKKAKVLQYMDEAHVDWIVGGELKIKDQQSN